MTEEESEMERINILIEAEDKKKLLELSEKADLDLSKLMRKIIKKVIS